MTSEGHLEHRRREILDAAVKCFEATGYATTTMEAIAHQAGIAKGSVYNYFSSKRDLFAELFNEFMTGYKADYDRLAGQPISATEKLTQLLDAWFAKIEPTRRIGRLIFEFWATAADQEQNDVSAWFSKTYADWRERLAAVISEGIERGEFREGFDVETAASLIIATVDGLTVQGILDGQMKVDAEFLAALKRAILTGLTARQDA